MVLIDTGNRTKVIFEALHATNLEAKKMTVIQILVKILWEKKSKANHTFRK